MRNVSNNNGENIESLLIRGDTSAFRSLFENFYRPLVFFANKYTANLDEAEDIVMETIEKIWCQKESIADIDNLSSFLFSSVRNRSIDFLRKQSRRPDFISDIPEDLWEDESVQESEMIYAQVLNLIHQHVGELPKECRKIFELLYYEHRTTAEIAKLLGLSVQSVRNQKTRAINILRTKIKPSNLLSLLILQTLFLDLSQKH